MEHPDGRIFELPRVDSGGRDILEDVDQILEETAKTGPAHDTDLVRMSIDVRN